MPRASFTTNTPGSCYHKRGASLSLYGSGSDMRSVSESVTSVRRTKPKGFLFPQPYTFSRTEIDRGYSTYTILNINFASSSYPRIYYGNVYGTYSNALNLFNAMHVVSFPSDLANRSNIDAHLSLKGMSVNLGQAFAERNQTARLIGDSAKKIAGFAKDIKNGKVRKVWKRLKSVKGQGLTKSKLRRDLRNQSFTDNWLAYQYGVKPLVSDVYGSIEALCKNSKSSFYFTAHGTARHNVDLKPVTSAELNGLDNRGTVRGFYLSKTGLIGLPKNEPLDVFASLGLTNPLLLAWELLPYSFVIDWFLPVGDYIDTFDSLLGFTDVTSFQTSFVKLEWEAKILTYNQVNSGGFIYGYKFEGDNPKKKYVYMDRVVNSAPIPITPPAFKDPRSLTHMANGLALLVSAFRK